MPWFRRDDGIAMTKKVHIRTLGCPKNETDSEHLRGSLERAGYTQALEADDADVVIVNTCSFIEAARRESVDAAVTGARQLCFDAGKVPLDLVARPVPSGPTAFVKISEGCDRVCTFCAIPAIRGAHRSRTIEAIDDEVAWLVARGVKEVVLV